MIPGLGDDDAVTVDDTQGPAALPDGGGNFDAGPGGMALDEAAQGQDVGQDAHPSSVATC